MNQPKHRLAFFAAITWLVLVLALCFHQVRFWSSNNLDSDVMALLPDTKHDALVSRANDNMAKVATRNIVILIGSADSEASKSAALTFDARIKKSDGLLRAQATSEQDTQAALDFYARYRDRLLTTQQKESLEKDSPDSLLQSGMERLYGIGASIGLSSWISDPLGMAPTWWQSRLGEGVTQEDGLLLTQGREKTWVVLQYESGLSAFQLDGVAHLQQLIESASNDAKRLHPEIEILNAGVPLHAEAAAVRASWEINTIGYGSLAAVMLLVFFAFMKLRPLVLVSGSLLIGCAAGISVTALIFGKVHLLTLVFGASLVGVAEDYGIHYFSSRQGNPDIKPFPMMRYLLPGMWLAFITSAVAYLALGMAPLPGLQQMAVFSAAGLLAAFLTVVCWFPYLDKKAAAKSWLSDKISHSLQHWPRWQCRKTSHKFLALGAVLFIVFGFMKLHAEDGLRQLQSSPPGLIKQQKDISEILGLPSPAQYLLVTANSEESLLQTEEALKPHLDTLVENSTIRSYNAISDWVPSAKRQNENRTLVSGVEKKMLVDISASLGESLERPDSGNATFTFKDWLPLKFTKTLQAQYLGEADGKWGSVVMINGLNSEQSLASLADLANSVSGVKLIDRSGEISGLLKHYRSKMTVLLFVGYLLVVVALYWRYKWQSWRALLPTVLAALLSLSASAWLGEPVQLFTVLAQFLILGTGVDYGIFLLEHHTDPSSWLAVCLGAASTLLAFGLLALSATPALHTFGLQMLFGVGLSWLLSPCFRLSVEKHAEATLAS